MSKVSKLPPGHSISVTADGMSESTPWFRYTQPESLSVEDATELIGERVRNSLERCWPIDGDAGLLLSGGVDSALILAGVTQMLEQPIRTFTFRYEDYQGKLNEGRNAQAIADHLGAPHEDQVGVVLHRRPSDLRCVYKRKKGTNLRSAIYYRYLSHPQRRV